MAQKGKFPNALNANREEKSSWIVDSGASDHMTGNPQLFQSYSPGNGNLSVRIADGTCSKVVGTGTIKVSKDIILHSVLLVPNLGCNLFSVSKLTRDLNCIAKFHSNICEVQELGSGKKIGNAELYGGLYILKVNNPS